MNAVGQSFQALQTHRKMSAALGPNEGMNLVNNKRVRRRENVTSPRRGQHQVKRLGRRNQDLRPTPKHLLAIPRRGVAGPNRDADLGKRYPALSRYPLDAD